VVIVLAVVGFRLFPGTDVTVVHDGRAYRVSATFQPENEALQAAGVSLSPGDRVLVGSSGGKQSFAVQRARPIRIQVDGELKEVNTLATTVGGALADLGTELRPGDRVFIGDRLTTPRGPLLSAGFVSRVVPARDQATEPDTALTINVVRARMITFESPAGTELVPSAAETVEDFLAEQGLTVREVEDLVTPGLSDPLPHDRPVRLERAQTIAVRLDGKDIPLYTRARTVGDILKVLDIDLGPDDNVRPTLGTLVTPGMQVTIGRTRIAQEVVEEPILPKTDVEYDPYANRDTVRLIEGSPGIHAVTFEVTYRNGEVLGKTEKGRVVLKPPINSRKIIGTRGAPAGGRPPDGGSAAGAAGSGANGSGVTGTKVLVTATWYDASHGAWAPDDPAYGTTKSGLKLRRGICAVDVNVIPMYTRFYVPGYGECLAADTGGGINGFHIDVGFEESDPDRFAWGVRDVEITILD
jgi:uncharacterized protein YabE (DUF348 family)/3D (Asp-Asp-Asp) domain-containing protein